SSFATLASSRHPAPIVVAASVVPSVSSSSSLTIATTSAGTSSYFRSALNAARRCVLLCKTDCTKGSVHRSDDRLDKKKQYNIFVDMYTKMSKNSGPPVSAERAAYEYLQGEILSGRLPGGSCVRQEEIAQRLSVSRIPVRDAIRHLAGDGLLTIENNRR